MSSALWNIASMTVGALITWAVARYYYRQAAKELQVVVNEVTQQLEKAAGDITLALSAFS